MRLPCAPWPIWRDPLQSLDDPETRPLPVSRPAAPVVPGLVPAWAWSPGRARARCFGGSGGRPGRGLCYHVWPSAASASPRRNPCFSVQSSHHPIKHTFYFQYGTTARRCQGSKRGSRKEVNLPGASPGASRGKTLRRKQRVVDNWWEIPRKKPIGQSRAASFARARTLFAQPYPPRRKRQGFPAFSRDTPPGGGMSDHRKVARMAGFRKVRPRFAGALHPLGIPHRSAPRSDSSGCPGRR